MIQKYLYNGSEITFNTDNGLMVNATEMAKQFGKTPKDWMRTNQTQDFLNALSIVRQISLTELIIQKQGGVQQGTWMHEDVALEFARWLNPSFAIWCNDRIKELLTTGKTEIPISDDEMILKSLKVLNDRVERMKEQNKLLVSTIEQQAPKAKYHDEVLQSESLININVIAKELGMSAHRLNSLLHEKGVIYKSGDTWVLYSLYQGRGFTKTKTYIYTDAHGHQKTAIHTYWTEVGREYIHQIFNNNLNKA